MPWALRSPASAAEGPERDEMSQHFSQLRTEYQRGTYTAEYTEYGVAFECIRGMFFNIRTSLAHLSLQVDHAPQESPVGCDQSQPSA